MISCTRIILLATLFLLSGSLEAARIKIATLAPEGTAWMKTMREGAKEIEKDQQEYIAQLADFVTKNSDYTHRLSMRINILFAILISALAFLILS